MQIEQRLNNMDIEKWLGEYKNRFGEPLPLMCFMGFSNEELVQVIEDCLRRGLDVEQVGYIEPDTLY